VVEAPARRPLCHVLDPAKLRNAKRCLPNGEIRSLEMIQTALGLESPEPIFWFFYPAISAVMIAATAAHEGSWATAQIPCASANHESNPGPPWPWPPERAAEITTIDVMAPPSRRRKCSLSVWPVASVTPMPTPSPARIRRVVPGRLALRWRRWWRPWARGDLPGRRDHVIPLYTRNAALLRFCLSGKTNLLPGVRASQPGLMPDGTSRFSKKRQAPSILHGHLHLLGNTPWLPEIAVAKISNAHAERCACWAAV